jgi:hypothetical protein
MLDAASVVFEFDSHILLSHVSGQIGLRSLMEVVTAASRLGAEQQVKGHILDYTQACTCLEMGEIPEIVRRSSELLGKHPTAIVDPHNHCQALLVACRARLAGRPVAACMTIMEARLFLDWAIHGDSKRARQFNRLFTAVSALPPSYLPGLISVVESFAARP